MSKIYHDTKIYAIKQKDETCYFLAIDFDDGEWQKDISQLREVCLEFDFPVAIVILVAFCKQ